MKFVVPIFLLLLASSAHSQALSWLKVNSNTTEQIGTVSFATRDTVYSAGSATLHWSTDAGLNWSQAPLPPIGIPMFYDARHGYLFAGKSASFTTDGGKTWTSAIYDLPYLDCYAIATQDTAFVCGGGVICRTTNGGRSWDRIGHIAPGNLYAMAFFDTKRGIAVGEPILGPQPGQQGCACYLTADGGASWQQQYIGGTSALRGVAYCSKNTIVATGDWVIHRSTDGGLTWTDIHSVEGDAPTAVAAYSKHLIAVNPGILESYDAGTTWFRDALTVSEQLAAVKMYDDTSAIVVGDNGIILRSSTSASSVRDQDTADLHVLVFPNPAQASVSFEYTVLANAPVSLSISDTHGALLLSPLSRQTQEGAQRLTIRTIDFTPGAYAYELTIGRRVVHGLFTIVR